MAAAALPIIGAVGSLFNGIFGADASNQAAQEYIQALQQAQQFVGGQETEGISNYEPYVTAGRTAGFQLNDLLGNGTLTAPWTGKFTAPTAAQAEATPGYQFQLQQGENAIQNSAAGQGGLLSGRTLTDLNNFAQGTASTNYQNVFNNALTQYQSAYNTFLNNQNNTYNKLIGASQLGLQGAGGEAALRTSLGTDQASLMAAQGAAAAGGTIGAANSIGSIFPGIASSLGGLSLGSLGGGSTASFNPNIWMGGPTYMPGGGSGFPSFDPNGTGMLPMSSLVGNMQYPMTPQV